MRKNKGNSVADEQNRETPKTIDFKEFYGDEPVRHVPNAALGRVMARYGVNIQTENRDCLYTVSPDGFYADSYVSQAAEALALMHKALKNAPNAHANAVLDKAGCKTIFAAVPGQASRATLDQCLDRGLEFNQAAASNRESVPAARARKAQRSAAAARDNAPQEDAGAFKTFNVVSGLGKAMIARIKLPTIEGRTDNQRHYISNMKKSEIAFGIAPAGTGKTFLAVAALTDMLVKGEVDSLVVTRPAVEAGEKIGFLPGAMGEKMDPYLIPIYTSFEKLLAGGDIQRGKQMLSELMRAGVITISPLAFMRGGEFERKGVLLDEGQNATETQLKMFITRLGVGGRMIITGDPEQTDLRPVSTSVLLHYARTFETLKDPDITTSWMTEADAVRHPKMTAILRTLRENPVPEDYNPYAVAGYKSVIAGKNTPSNDLTL